MAFRGVSSGLKSLILLKWLYRTVSSGLIKPLQFRYSRTVPRESRDPSTG
jgi:hypothetical protein